MSRSADRASYSTVVRVQLLEHDMDEHEVAQNVLRDDIAKIMRILMGVLIALSASAIGLAANMAIRP